MLLGLQLVGGVLCLRGRQGRRTLAIVLVVTVAYVVMAVVPIALR